ncbi:MAG: C39 family peptidase [archaeon]
MKKLSVQLIEQDKLECGPTALAMVLRYFKKKISPGEITKEIGGIKKYGASTINLADFARRRGFKVYCYSYNKKLSKGKAEIKKPKKLDIIKFLDMKLPMIIAVRSFLLYDEKPSSEGHFVVITKYEKGKFYYNDPFDGKEHKIKENDLMFVWFNNVLDSSAYLLVLEPQS